MTDILKIVLVGCGGISDLWFKAVAEMNGVSIVGLVDLSEASAQAKKAQYALRDAKIGTDLKSVLTSTRCDIVFDCTIPGARASVVSAALAHGCHVLSEKPMANNMAEARELIEASKKADRLFSIMQNRRYDPRIRAFGEFLKSGSIGPLTTLNGDFYLGAHFGGFREHMAHVLLLDMAIHSFDQARLISGADPVSVYCHEWNPTGSWYERDASAVAIFEMSNGIIYTYRGSWCAEGLNTLWECDWRAAGTKGMAKWDGGNEFRAQCVAGDEGFIRPMQDLTISVSNSLLGQGHAGCIQDFIQCVRTNQIPETHCTDNIKSLAMVFGAIESSRTGKRVSIT